MVDPDPESKITKPKVTVWMTVYNDERYVAQALESAVSQVVDVPFEIVVGEDCSTDRTAEIVRRFQERYPGIVRPIFWPQNLGASRNAIATLHYCRGEYLTLLQGDDYWTSPLKLQKQVDYLEAHPSVALCFHRAWMRWEDGSREPVLVPETPQEDFTLEDLLRENVVHGCTPMFRRAAFPGFPKWFAKIPTGDWVMYILTARTGSLHCLSDAMAVYRVRKTGWAMRPVDERIRWAAKMYGYLRRELDGKHRRFAERRQVDTYLNLAAYYHHRGNLREARRAVRDRFIQGSPVVRLRDSLWMARLVFAPWTLRGRGF